MALMGIVIVCWWVGEVVVDEEREEEERLRFMSILAGLLWVGLSCGCIDFDVGLCEILKQ